MIAFAFDAAISTIITGRATIVFEPIAVLLAFETRSADR